MVGGEVFEIVAVVVEGVEGVGRRVATVLALFHGRNRRKGDVGGDEQIEVGLVVAELRGLREGEEGEDDGGREVCRESELICLISRYKMPESSRDRQCQVSKSWEEEMNCVK